MTNPDRHIDLRARLFAACSAAALIVAAPALAQAPVRDRSPVDFTRGKRIDHSGLVTLPVAPNTEREGREFGPLGPSSIGGQGLHIVTPPAPPPGPDTVRAVVEGQLNGANFESGRAILLPQARETLTAVVQRLHGRKNLAFEIVGHTDNQRISSRLRSTYPDNQALSKARAQAVADFLREALGLTPEAISVQGFGETQPVAGNDTPQGLAANRRTVIRASYDERDAAPPPAPSAPVAVKVPVDYCAPAPLAGAPLPFSISVDGQPLDADSAQTEADRQRCVDVALDRADIQIKYDPLNVAPALNVWALPGVIGRGGAITWQTYSNYVWWVKRAEVRLFYRSQSSSEQPAAVLPVNIGGQAQWTPPPEASEDVGYVLRVYDADGRFDETALKTTSLLDIPDLPAEQDRTRRDALTGYGESSLKVRNIPVSGGSVTISGERVEAGETVTAMGAPVPVDDKGRFVTRQIMPSGSQRVAVAVKDAKGHEATFTRNLNIADKDWFYVAVADLTAANGRTTGPAALVTTDLEHYDKKTTFDGRLAFYLKGKILGKYLLTASADTREQPVKDLFSNFTRKDPNYLLRRIDPNRYYPVYGDDSTIVDDAPTQGKFYVRLERDSSYVMWGAFQTAWTGVELTQFSRGLYGGNLVWQSQAITSGGERRTTLNAFAAEPGTLQSREAFRSTGGSLYYLRRQDVTQGSERLWAEVRDRDSGLVRQRTLLAPSQDYDIDYLQGRLTLRAPLPILADGSGLVQTSSLSGDPVYLIATYEYVPSLTAVHGSTMGARASAWVTDWLRLGGSYYSQGDGGLDQKLGGVDATLRIRPNTWLAAEVARSRGLGPDELASVSGGFDFSRNVSPRRTANAYRIDGTVDLAEITTGLNGRVSAYAVQRDAGFSGPGLVTPNGEGVRQAGFSAVLPVHERAEIALRVDNRSAGAQSGNSQEAALRYKLNPEWGVSLGLRRDERSTDPTAPGLLVSASPTLARNGERSDGVVRLDYRPLKSGPSQAASAAAPPNALAPDRTYAPPTSLTSPTADADGPAGSLLPSAIGRTPGVLAPIFDPEAAAGVAAARIAGLDYRNWNAYAYGQQTLSRSGNRPSNDRAGVGMNWQVSHRLRLGGEASGGNGGAGGKVSADYAISDRSTLYMSYARETEVPDQTYAGRQSQLTAGGRMRLNEQLGVFAESRAASGEGPHSLTHGFGVDYAPAKAWTTGLRFDTGRISDRVAGDLRRYAVSLNLGYRNERLKAGSTVEYRHDSTTSLGAVSGTCASSPLATATPCISAAGSQQRETILFKSAVSYQADPALRLLGSLNLSRSSSSQGAFYDGDYAEAVLGAAYRPVNNDRWNTLFKYTYFYNLPSSGQVDNVRNNLLDYTQRSHVLSIDTIYDVTPWLSVGGKYGLRVGDLRDSRTTGQWYSSQAQLFVLRADVHFVKAWDAVLEGRQLRVREANDQRTGVLAGVYRHLGENGKIGVGYNFTDFSDDLTDLSYRSRGFFINAIAKF